MRAHPFFLIISAIALPGLSGCSSGGPDGTVPGDQDDNQPFAQIAESEMLHVSGTEPFWGAQAKGTVLTYTTPEKPEGEAITIRRFAGRAGLTLSGNYHGETFDMMVTEGTCSDGMSDRTYPFTVTLRLGSELRDGCGWSDSHPVKELSARAGAG
ncbi:COG3650 family protein [Altericroceibacterium endophyticum]|uniref:Lipoprotein n=1 Tax=Altericroceibacterium endophyticum TaxID=1808508 RepID=A0A6I4TB61_9SPHN|nr:hypothetical protein [Altericroceibacterium endophyticum]MXO66975.1 hypothetical protein [Altericroceibacterium endophyticum]